MTVTSRGDTKTVLTTEEDGASGKSADVTEKKESRNRRGAEKEND